MRHAAFGVTGARRAAWALALLLLTSATAQGQNTCQLIDSRLLNFVARGTAAEAIFISRPVISCEDGARIVSDSAIIVPSQNLSRLFGNVRFAEQSRTLTAARADYYSRQDRLHAWGGVVLSDPLQGSTIDGDTVVYLRAGDTRALDRITVTGRTVHATLVPRPSPPVVAQLPDSLAPDSTMADSIEADPRLNALGAGRSAADSVAMDFFATTLSAVELVAGVVRASGRLAAQVLIANLRASGDLEGLPADRLLTEPPAPRDSTPEDTVLARAPGDTALAPDTTRPPDPAAVQESPQDSTVASMAVVAPRAAPDSVQTPYNVTARRRIVIDGGSSFEAEGDVEIERDALQAFADRVRYDQSGGQLFLLGNARSEGTAYDLTANSIVLVLPGQAVREIVALQNAVLSTEDIDLTAPKIHMFVQDSELERLVAGFLSDADSIPVIGAGQPGTAPVRVAIVKSPEDTAQATALAEDFRLSGDSIEVLTPNQELDRVLAAGRARGVSLSKDAMNTEETLDVARSDWLEGDTIIATFAAADPTVDSAVVQPPPGAGNRYDLNRLVALGAARTLYRMAPSDSTQAANPHRLAIHYVVGEAITIDLTGGEVERMQVQGQTQGIHLEPLVLAATDSALSADSGAVVDTTGVGSDRVPVAADTLVVPPDTTAAAPDTTQVAPDPTRVEANATRFPREAIVPRPARRPGGGSAAGHRNRARPEPDHFPSSEEGDHVR